MKVTVNSNVDCILSLSTFSKELIGEKNLELLTYTIAYNHWRVMTLEPDCRWTWIIAGLATDHGYYWAHRMMHECNIIWAAHQVTFS